MPYDFSIVHKAGKENKGADAMSYRPYLGELLTFIIPFCVEVADIKAGLQTDSFTSKLITKLQTDPSCVLDFSLVDQLSFHHRRMVIPEIHNLKLKLLEEAHDTPIGGHGGFFKNLQKTFFSLLLAKDKRGCEGVCPVMYNVSTTKVSDTGSSRITSTPTHSKLNLGRCFHGFIVGLQPSSRFDTILVVVDRLRKYPHFICLSIPIRLKE
ncbi:hypothetical protein Tco_1295619 [Tanacetum coccineum]